MNLHDKTGSKNQISTFEGGLVACANWRRVVQEVQQRVEGLRTPPGFPQVETSVSRWRKVAVYGRLIE